MAVIKCKMCGGDLIIEEGSTVAECEYCGSRQTIPTQDNEKKLTLFSRANRLRMNSEFDKAFGIYESIVADFPEEAEAYWGLVLCKYGIEYVDDPATGKKIPTCHRSSFDSVMDDKDFEQTCENADGIARKVYREEAKAIEEIRKGIIEVSGKEEPYDIFICYKETAENGDRTIDSVIAQDVYDALTAKGYRVFFSRITLEDKLGQEYEPYIFAALNSAKIMLAFGTDYEYYNAVWVKNEWSRYLKLMAKDKSKHLIPCYKNIDAYDMPKEFAKLQAQDMGKVGAVQDLLRGIEKILGGKKEETVPAAAPVQQVIQQVVGGPNASALLDRGYMSLEDGAFEEATGFFNDALNSNAKCAEAYLGLFMAEIQAEDKLTARSKFVAGDYAENRYYQRAKKFAEGTLKAELADWEEQRDTRLKEEAEEEARKAKEEAEEKARKAKEVAEAARKRKAEIAAIREQLKTGNFVMTAEQETEQSRLHEEAEQAKKQAENAYADYTAMPEYAQKVRLDKEITDMRAYLSRLGIFKGKEKKQVQEQIARLEASLEYVARKLEEAKNKAETLADTAKAKTDTAAAYRTKVDNETRKKLQIELLKVVAPNENVTFGNYPQAKEGEDRTPIEWIVLSKEEGKILVISKYALDCQQYNTNYTDVTWESCSLRKWMNGTFLNNAFSAEEQTLIQNTTVSADKNPKYSTNPGNATTDKVFLLSIAEAEKYFTTDESRKCAPTAYAEAQGAYISESYITASGEATCKWWLRSPGGDQRNAAFVDHDGSVYYFGSNVHIDLGCVRPALWINLDS